MLISLLLLWAQGSWAFPVPSPSLLLESWQQLDADFQRAIRSYKLEGVASKRLYLTGLPSSQLHWSVWRDGKRFLWKCTISDTLSGEREYAYSFDGVRYYCYNGPASQGFTYGTPQDLQAQDLPPCENAFGGLYPFDVSHFWQKPLAGGSWQSIMPYYVTLLQNVPALRVSKGKDTQAYILLVSRDLKRRMVWMPDEFHFRLEREKFIPVRFVLRDKGQSTETAFEITSALWYDGCWLPSSYRVTWTDVTKGEVLMEGNATIRVYDINKPIPSKHFRFDFPAGTLVTDEKGVEKTVAAVSRWNLVWAVFAFVVLMTIVFWIAKRLRRFSW